MMYPFYDHVSFSANRKVYKNSHPWLFLVKILLSREQWKIFQKKNRTIWVLRKFRSVSKRYLVAIYGSFIGSHLDYDDMIFDQANKILYQQNLEPVQYKGCSMKRLFIGKTIPGISFGNYLSKIIPFT